MIRKSHKSCGKLLIRSIAIGLVASCFMFSNGTYAAQNTKPGLTLSPLRTELEIAPGTSQDRTLTLSNANDRPITVRLTTEEFSVINQQYDYAFNIETQLTKWVTFTPDTLDLASGETKTATFRIGVPIGAEPGGRYLSLFASTDAGSSIEGVVSRQRIASLVYINVSGDISRSGNLVALNAPWLVIQPTDWTASLQNTGSTHYRTDYSVTTKPLIGDATIRSIRDEGLILPGTIRLIKDTLPLPNLPGIYKVMYKIGLGDSPAVTETRIMVYLPPVAIIVSLFAIILILSLISEYRNRKKKSNRSVERPYK